MNFCPERAGQTADRIRSEPIASEHQALCFGDFHLGQQMKVTRPPGRDPADGPMQSTDTASTAQAKRFTHFTRTHLNSNVSLGHCTTDTFFCIAHVSVRRYSGM